MKYLVMATLFFTQAVFAGIPVDEPICIDDPMTASGISYPGYSTIEALIDDGQDCEIQGMNFGHPLVVGEYVYVTVPADYMSSATLNDHEIEVELDGALENFIKGKRFTFAKLMAPGNERVARIDMKKKPVTPACYGCADFAWMVIIDWFDQEVLVQNDKFYFPADARLAINYYRDTSASPAVSGIKLSNLSGMMNTTTNSLSPVESPALSSYQVGIIRTFADIPADDYILFSFPSYNPYW